MATVNETIFDIFVRRQLYLINYANNLSKESGKLLKNTDEKAEQLLLFYATKLEGIPITSPRYKSTVNKLLKELTKLRAPAYRALRTTLPDEMLELSQIEAIFAATTISNSLPLAEPLEFKQPKKDDLKQTVKDITLPQGQTIDESIEELENLDAKRMTTQLSTAMRAGSTPTQAVAQVKKGAIKHAKNALSTIASTSVISVSTQARSKLYETNKNFVKQEIFRATLDSGTTPGCIALDGNLFDVGDAGRPRIPRHYNCRSIYLPYLDPNSYWERPFDPTTEKILLSEYAKKNKLKNIKSRADLPRGEKGTFDKFARQQRRARIGRVPEKTDYNLFLSKQSTDFQNEVLGKKRAALYRKSGQPISKFVNGQGKFINLDELKARLNS